MLGTNDLKPRFQVPPVQIGDLGRGGCCTLIRHS